MSAVRGARRGPALAALLAWVLLATPVGFAAPAAAAGDWADFGTPTATSSFVEGVKFNQPVTLSRASGRAELLLTAAGAIGPTVIETALPPGIGADTLSYVVDPNAEGHLLPNTPLTARWRLTAADDPSDVALGPPVRVTYADDRFDWRTESGDLVTVHWYEGNQAFGSRALQVGEDAVQQAADLLEVTESDPIDFFVYADQDAFYDALGPGTRENVGGSYIPGTRLMFALIPTDQIDQPWVGIVIPHELTHLVFDTAASNPYHFPPRWLNEGLAVYLSQGYDPSDRADVERAADAGTLIPLDGIIGQFPTSFDRFSLAYSESVSAVDYLIRAHGRDPLVSLIRSYAQGRTDDEAFSAALGVDMTAFGEAWLADLGAAAPTRYGPQSAPPGPIPGAWLAGPGSSPGSGSGSSAGPGVPDEPVTGGSSESGVLLVVVVVVILVVVGGFVTAVVVSRRRRARTGPI